MARSPSAAEMLLGILEAEASGYGLKLNRGKTVHLAVNSQARIRFPDGYFVPAVTSVRYLGVLIDSKADYGREISSRISSAAVAFKALKPLWRSTNIARHHKMRVYAACIIPHSLYAIGTAWPADTQLRRLESRHVSFLR
eukprot:8792773-Alexandrium_andersonii.AAC.1